MKEMQKQPTMMTIREIARTGLMSEHALRMMLKAGKLPAIFIGKKALINYDMFMSMAFMCIMLPICSRL